MELDAKFFIRNLPAYIPETQHTASYPIDGKALVLFPLFRWGDGAVDMLNAWIIRGALWARRSWVLNTDAVEHGVKIAFYVGDKSEDVIFPSLKKAVLIPRQKSIYLMRLPVRNRRFFWDG